MNPLKIYLATAPRGAATRLAENLGISPVIVSQWIADESPRPVPGERCPAIERATEGAVKCEDIREDLTWQRVPDSTWPHPDGRPCLDVAAPKTSAPEVPEQRPLSKAAA